MGMFSLLGSLLGVEVETLVQRVRESAIAFAAIGVFVLICITFLLVALYTALDGRVGPVWSPLIIAGGALVIAIILFIVLKIQEAAVKRRAEERRKEAESTALLATAAASALPELLASPAVRNVGLPILLYAGLLLVSRPKSKPQK
jgi:large-conductance mechanosensitive channel